jgi:hypothetical protein
LAEVGALTYNETAVDLADLATTALAAHSAEAEAQVNP